MTAKVNENKIFRSLGLSTEWKKIKREYTSFIENVKKISLPKSQNCMCINVIFINPTIFINKISFQKLLKILSIYHLPGIWEVLTRTLRYGVLGMSIF